MSVQDQASDLVPVSIFASEVSLPGLYLIHDFISAKEEEVMDFSFRINANCLAYHVCIFCLK